MAQASGFLSEPRTLAELIRVDIDRRYSADAVLPISEYAHAFPILLTSDQAMAAIALKTIEFDAQHSWLARRHAGLGSEASTSKPGSES